MGNKKPKPEQFGYESQTTFDGEESGWRYEGGEDAYYEALTEWEETHNDIDEKN